ncbi:MAG: thioredoxin family protein [Candidatus Heimdallarchaeaceae archaeon]
MLAYKSFIEKGQDYFHFVHRTKKNEKRFEEFYTLIKIPPTIQEKIKKVDSKITILSFAENWCTDSVSVIPILEKISELNSNIQQLIIPQDEVLDEFNAYFLTGGKTKIPFILFLNERFEEVNRWVERSTYTYERIFELKEKQLSKVDYYKAVLSLYTSQEIIDETVKELSDALYRAWLIAKGTK